MTRVRYALDRLDDPIIPRKGLALVGNLGWQDANPAASGGFPLGELTVNGFHPVSSPASLYFIAAGGSTAGYDHTGLPPFSLGGPARLAAYGTNQFLSNQYLYLRGGYLHQLGTLPAFVGKGLYLDAHYEVGKPYEFLKTPASENSPSLPNDGVVGLVTETTFGPLFVGGSLGEAGHRKWFFQVGRVF